MSTDTYWRGNERVIITFDDETNAFVSAVLYLGPRQVARTTDMQAAEAWMNR